MRVAIWMNIPSHYQSGFFSALRRTGVDLVVRYYNTDLLSDRAAQGWQPQVMENGEMMVEPTLAALETIPDWRSRVHVVPGYGSLFLRKLSSHLSRERVDWVHWSECAHPGARWYLSYWRKHSYARLVARHALGAFAQGRLAMDDFVRWGVPIEMISFLSYTTQADSLTSPPLDIWHERLNGRSAFIFVGAQCSRKAVDVLLKAFASISEAERRTWALLIVGKDFECGRYIKMTKHLHLTESVIFQPPITSDRVQSGLRCAKVLVLPSRVDGWGVVLNEAASMGLALIGSDHAGASHHLISPGVNGFRVRAGDVESLRSAMLAYIHNPRLAEKHGLESLKIITAYTPEKSAERFLAAIESWRSMKGEVTLNED